MPETASDDMAETELSPFTGDGNDWVVQTMGLYKHCKGYDMRLTKAQYDDPARARSSHIEKVCEAMLADNIAKDGGSEKRRMICEWTDSSDAPHKRAVWVWY